MRDEALKFDVTVVGAGPSGLTAAYLLAQKGLDVVVVERGAYPGAKNLSGLLYSGVLEEVVGDFQARAPLERPVCRRVWGLLGSETHGMLEVGSNRWSSPPFNHSWVVYRARFDRWLASEAEQVGANVLDGMVVDDLVYEGEGPKKRVVGVRIRDDEPIYSDVVILAEGAMGILTQRAQDALRMRRPARPQIYGLGVKEIWGLPAQVIEDRFHLEPHEGAAQEWVGGPFEGLVGGGFIYTGRESLAVGVIVAVEGLKSLGKTPYEVLDAFKAHREINKYLQGAELLEYGAHILPEGGYPSVGQLADNGLLIVGDAAGLVNPTIYHEGANLAMASGMMAAKAVLHAREMGRFDRETLCEYERLLWSHPLMEDVRNIRNIREAHKVFPRVMSTVPERLLRFVSHIYEQQSAPKRRIQRNAVKELFRGLSPLRTARDLWRMRRMLS